MLAQPWKLHFLCNFFCHSCFFFSFVSFYGSTYIVWLETQSFRCSPNPLFWCSFSLQKSQPWNSKRRPLFSTWIFLQAPSSPPCLWNHRLFTSRSWCLYHSSWPLSFLTFFSLLFKELQSALLFINSQSMWNHQKVKAVWKSDLSVATPRFSAEFEVPGGTVFHYIGIGARCHLSSQARGALVGLTLSWGRLPWFSLCLAGDTCSSPQWWWPPAERFFINGKSLPHAPASWTICVHYCCVVFLCIGTHCIMYIGVHRYT